MSRKEIIGLAILGGVAVVLLSYWAWPPSKPEHNETSFTIARPHCALHIDTIDCVIKHLPRSQP